VLKDGEQRTSDDHVDGQPHDDRHERHHEGTAAEAEHGRRDAIMKAPMTPDDGICLDVLTAN